MKQFELLICFITKLSKYRDSRWQRIWHCWMQFEYMKYFPNLKPTISFKLISMQGERYEDSSVNNWIKAAVVYLLFFPSLICNSFKISLFPSVSLPPLFFSPSITLPLSSKTFFPLFSFWGSVVCVCALVFGFIETIHLPCGCHWLSGVFCFFMCCVTTPRLVSLS